MPTNIRTAPADANPERLLTEEIAKVAFDYVRVACFSAYSLVSTGASGTEWLAHLLAVQGKLASLIDADKWLVEEVWRAVEKKFYTGPESIGAAYMAFFGELLYVKGLAQELRHPAYPWDKTKKEHE